MRRIPIFDLLATSFLMGVLILISQPVAAQTQVKPPSRTGPNSGTVTPRTYTVSGMVSDADSHTRIDSVRVELRSQVGGLAGTVFTSGDGNFQFNNIAPGNYQVVVEESGYRTATQQIDVTEGPVSGIYLELHSNPVASGVSPGSQTISKRELSIPHKAHDDMQKGLALLNGKSDYKGSIKEFDRAIQEYPDYYEAYAQMGVAYLRLGNAASAEQALRKSVDLSQDHYVDALYWLATLLSNAERFADAEPVARKGVELDPGSWQSNSELARALFGLNRPEEAEKSAMAAVKLRPDNPNLYLLLANIHDQLQNDQALLDDLNNYLRLAPNGPFATQVRQQRDQVQQALGVAHGTPAALAPTKP